MNIVYHTMVYMYKVKAHILPCVYFCYTKHMQVVRKIRSFRFFFVIDFNSNLVTQGVFARSIFAEIPRNINQEWQDIRMQYV